MAAPDLDLILVVDVGNSGAKLGAVRGDTVAGPVRLPRADGRAVGDMAKPMLQGRKAVVAIAGSDPKKVEGLAWEVRKLALGTCVNVDANHPGIPAAKVDQPHKAGVDRRVQALAAVNMAGEASVVLSCGTALTIDLADADGALLGGAILPGVGLGAVSLAERTAALPRVDLKGEVSMPAKNTEEAIRTGLLLGAAGAVDRLLAHADIPESMPVYLTGFDAAALAPHLKRPVRSSPGLGMYGVALAVRAAPPRR